MYATIALIVICSALLMLFSDDLIGFIKKLNKIPGFSFVLPIVIASALVVVFEAWLIFVLSKLYQGLQYLVFVVYSYLPSYFAAVEIAQIIILAALTLIPVTLFDTAYSRSHYTNFRYTSFLLLFVFVFLSMLLIVASI